MIALFLLFVVCVFILIHNLTKAKQKKGEKPLNFQQKKEAAYKRYGDALTPTVNRFNTPYHNPTHSQRVKRMKRLRQLNDC